MTESESVSEVIFLTTFMWGPDLRRKEGRRKLQVSVFCHPKPLTAAYCSRIPSGAQQSAAGSPTLQSRQRPCGGGGGGPGGDPVGWGGPSPPQMQVRYQSACPSAPPVPAAPLPPPLKPLYLLRAEFRAWLCLRSPLLLPRFSHGILIL